MKALLISIAVAVGMFFAVVIGVGIGAGIKHQDKIATSSEDKGFSDPYSEYDTEETSTPESSPTPQPLTISDFGYDVDGYSRYAVGKITNTFDRPLSYLGVRINLYDANGNIVGDTLDNITYVAPGDTWSFKAVIIEDNATNATVVDIDYSY